MAVLHSGNLNPHTSGVSKFSNKLLLCGGDSNNKVEACLVDSNKQYQNVNK